MSGFVILDRAFDASFGVTRTTLSELVNEKRGIYPEMALIKAVQVFGGCAGSWVVQQAQYDLAQVPAERFRSKRLETRVAGQVGPSVYAGIPIQYTLLVLLPRFLSLGLLASVALCQGPQSITVTSAASLRVGLPPNGSIGTIFCTGLNVDGVVSAHTLPLPLTLAGISVTVDGWSAPLLAVANSGAHQQINFQVPQEVVRTQPISVIVVSQDGHQGSGQASLSDSPGDFFWIAGGLGAFQHAADFSLVTEQNPAHAGEVVVGYLTGLGSTEPAVPTGEPAPISPLAIVPQPNEATYIHQFALLLNGEVIANDCSTRTCQTSNILFLGLTPGLVGVYRINFVVPTWAPARDAAVQLQVVTCAAIFATPCGGRGLEFTANASAGCGGIRTKYCTSSAVRLPIRLRAQSTLVCASGLAASYQGIPRVHGGSVANYFNRHLRACGVSS